MSAVALLVFGQSWLCCLATASAADPPAATGAKIDESKVAKTYYVDAAAADAADDDKHGTQESPFLTIKHAVEAAVRDKDANVGAKIVIAAGTYRESIEIPAPKDKIDTDAPLVIEATERDQTIIECADAKGISAETWKQDGAAWVHRWFGTKPNGTQVSELLILDGIVVRQTASPATLTPGAFCEVSALDEKRRPVVNARLLPPEDTEVSADSIFQLGARTSGVTILNRRNVVVRGLMVQHASGFSNNFAGSAERVCGVGIYGCSNVLIEDVLSQWNDGSGLFINGGSAGMRNAGITLRRVRLIHNGGSGLEAAATEGLLAEDCETSFNNFRGEWAGKFDPEGAAGLKARNVHGSTWRRQRAVGNQARGLWWVGDCTDLLIEDAVVQENLFSGLLIENCPGPSIIRGCLVADNKMPSGAKPEASQPAAVSIEASPDVTLENNVAAGNAMPQFGVRDVAERTDGVNFETGAKTTLRSERHAYHHNAFCGLSADQILCDLPTSDRAGKSDFAFYYSTLDSDENCFWNPASDAVFTSYDRTGARTKMPLAAWRSFLAGRAGANAAVKPEAGSLWQDPQFMEPGEGDFRLQTQSPLIDWGLPSEEGGAAQ